MSAVRQLYRREYCVIIQINSVKIVFSFKIISAVTVDK